MHRYAGTVVGVGLLVVLALAVFVRQTDFDVDVPFVGGGGSDPSANALRQDRPPPYSPPTIADVRGALTIDEPLPSPDRILTVSIDAPPDAQAMQVADTPTFAGLDWGPVEPRADVAVGGIGYRNVFVRFQLADGSITRTSVIGGQIDPTITAATASADGGPHQASWVRPFSSTEVALRVEAGRIEAGALEPYDLDNPQAGDDIGSERGLPVVRRNGETYGLGVSARRDVIRRPDRLVGRPLDVDDVVGGDWTITSADDPAFGAGVAPVSVRHLARPSDGGFDGGVNRLWALVHDLVIVLPQPLTPGASYEITGPGLAPATLRYDPTTTTSPAVRVNQAGFAPGDQAKVAHLSGWYDGIGTTATATTEPGFQVVDAATGEAVFTGTGRLRPQGNELGQGDLTGAPVVELDFTSVDRPGTYRVCVDAIGCSHPFEIDAEVWNDLAATVARAVYHQRSGVQLGPPYTSFVRPRPYHPDDGVRVVASTYTLLQAQTETENTNFERLTELRTDQVVDGAWGGHFDAGDWDRRIQHLWFARHTAQLVTLFPDRFQDFDLNIPESGDGVPDLLDEAMWTVDLFRRMQTPEGGIRGGIEASEHPPANAASWVDDLAVLAYDPDPFSSYVYAGVAAEVSVALRPYDPTRASELLASAERAMVWADDQAPFVGEAGRVAEQRSVAAAALLLATGDSQWHDRFVEAAGFLADPEPHLSCHRHTACDAAWLYLQADEGVTDPAIRQQLEARFLASADAIVAIGEQTAYGWTLENPGVPLIWGLGVGGNPKVSGLLRAYVLSGDETYRAAAVRSASVALGSNPLGQVFYTGVGEEPVRHPQINDVKNGGLPAWPGTPVYGFHSLNLLADEQWVVDDLLGPAGVSPSPTDLPYLWQWYDVDSIAQYNEFTLHQSHAEALLAFGLLGATSSGS